MFWRPRILRGFWWGVVCGAAVTLALRGRSPGDRAARVTVRGVIR